MIFSDGAAAVVPAPAAHGEVPDIELLLGIKEIAEKIWLVSFMQYDLGFFDHESGRVECAPNPFRAQVLPMCPE
jgi:hypothetical protein